MPIDTTRLLQVYKLFRHSDPETDDLPPDLDSEDGDWGVAKEAMETCFTEYGWIPRGQRMLRISYVLLILLQLVFVDRLSETELSEVRNLLKEVKDDIRFENHKVPEGFKEAIRECYKAASKIHGGQDLDETEAECHTNESHA